MESEEHDALVVLVARLPGMISAPRGHLVNDLCAEHAGQKAAQGGEGGRRSVEVRMEGYDSVDWVLARQTTHGQRDQLDVVVLQFVEMGRCPVVDGKVA